jgi:hypothetical protein
VRLAVKNPKNSVVIVRTAAVIVRSAEGVSPVPGEVGPAEGCDGDTGVEPTELPGAAREREGAGERREIENDVPVSVVVARPVESSPLRGEERAFSAELAKRSAMSSWTLARSSCSSRVSGLALAQAR